MLQGFKTEEELHLFAQLYFFEPEFTDEELRQKDEAASLLEWVRQLPGACKHGQLCRNVATLISSMQRVHGSG